MLTRVMIVDDEVFFRNNIKTVLNWESHGFFVCGEAGGGLSAKALIEKLKPDIVITDICMAEIDGLELIAFLCKNYPNIQIIALSGYDQYDYVRASMKNGVVDYLLKHQLTENTLITALMTARERISNKEKEQQDYLLLQDQIEQGQLALRQSFLLEWLSGEIREEASIKKRIKELEIPLDSHEMIMVVAEIDGMSRWKQKYSALEWRTLFDRTVGLVADIVSNMGQGVVIPQPDNRFTILFSMKNTRSLLVFYNYVSACIQQIRSHLKMQYNLTACYSMSENIYKVSQLSEVYQKTSAKLQDKIYHDYDVVIREKAIPQPVNENYNISVEEEQTIIRHVKGMDEAATADYLQSIFEMRRKNHLDSSRLQILFAELLNILNRVLREDNLDMVSVYPGFHSLFENIQHMTFAEMKNTMIHMYQEIIKARTNVNGAQGELAMTRRARLYIEKNFASDISLSDISEEIGVTPSYLSRAFKKDAGKNVVEYLNEYRVKQAQKMISGGVRLSELHRLVGFNSNTYFFTVFKQITGLTPTQFKKRTLLVEQTVDQPQNYQSS